MIQLQLAQFTKEWATVDLGARKPYDVLIVASMGRARDRRARGAEARLRRDLEPPAPRECRSRSTQTLRYGLGIPGNRPITAAELKNQTPYNTSIRPGLPPTPIGNPGLPSIQAAAHPAAVDYLYYVRKPDHRHHFFTASEAEFCAKAKEYGYHPC